MKILNSLTIEADNLPPKGISLIRKNTGLSISEIKERAVAGKPIVEAPLSDDDSLAKMISLSKELAELGISYFFQQAGRKVDDQFIENVLVAHQDTAHELGLDK